MSEKEKLSRALDREFRKWRRINALVDRVMLSIMLAFMAFIGSGLIDSLMFLEEGMSTLKYHSFEQLLATNPDTVAWLSMDGTHIDHPVVRSRDNFDYLDTGFDGKYYAGGTIFLDKDNSSIEDPYCIVHGHHMAGGAMFGDLGRYLDPEFFDEHQTGRLLTPEYDYDIMVLAAGIFNAYDNAVFNAGENIPSAYAAENAVNLRNDGEFDHVLALSTCLDDMTDNRIVVFCRLLSKRTHR